MGPYVIHVPSKAWTLVAVVQWDRVFACKRKVQCSNPSRDRTKSLKTGSDSFIARHSVTRMRVTGPPKWMDFPSHNRCGTLKNPTWWMHVPCHNRCWTLKNPPRWMHVPCHNRCGTLKNPQRWMHVPCHNRCGTLKTTHYSMTMCDWGKNSRVGRKTPNKQTTVCLTWTLVC